MKKLLISLALVALAGCSNTYVATAGSVTLSATVSIVNWTKPLIFMTRMKDGEAPQTKVLGPEHFGRCDVANSSNWYCVSSLESVQYKMENGEFSIGTGELDAATKEWTVFERQWF